MIYGDSYQFDQFFSMFCVSMDWFRPLGLVSMMEVLFINTKVETGQSGLDRPNSFKSIKDKLVKAV